MRAIPGVSEVVMFEGQTTGHELQPARLIRTCAGRSATHRTARIGKNLFTSEQTSFAESGRP
jgi:hypothetical protein